MVPLRNPITDTYFRLLLLGKGLFFSFHCPFWGRLPLKGNRAFSFPKLTHCPTSILNVRVSGTILNGLPVTETVGRYFAETSGAGMIWKVF